MASEVLRGGGRERGRVEGREVFGGLKGKGREGGAVDEMSVAVRLLYRLNQTLTHR